MKKYFCLVFALFFGVIFTGCSFKKNETVNLSPEINGNLDIEHDGKEYTCYIDYKNEKNYSFEIKTPKQLESLTFSVCGDKSEIKFKELGCELSSNFESNAYFLKEIAKVINEVSNGSNLNIEKSKNKEIIISGSTDSGAFSVTTDNDGNINFIDIKEKKIKVKFNDNVQRKLNG